MSKLIVVLGPTASGKTSLAVNLAYRYNAEIISADSRQIYENMDIGTGKDLNEYQINQTSIPYHLIDILTPDKNYSVYDYQNDFVIKYNEILKKKKTSILCGGTGLYIESILLDYKMNDTPPNIELRNKLEKKSLEELIAEIKEKFIDSYDVVFHTTKRRIIRTIEILLNENKITKSKKNKHKIDYLVLGIKIKREDVLIKIKERLETRLNEGMIDEVKMLIDSGITLERLKYFGLEYKFIGEYLFNNMTYDNMKERLNYAINRFAKRQMTFFRRMEKRGIKIQWVNPNKIDQIYNNVDKYIQ